MSRNSLKAGFAWLFVFMVAFGIVPAFVNAAIGEGGGTTSLKSDMEMMSGIPVHGGGHATWKVSGPAAIELRQAIIREWDEPAAQGPPNGRLEATEVEAYYNEIDRYLEANPDRRFPGDDVDEDVENLQYHGANLRRFALLNRDVKDDTKGLIGTSNSSTGPIEIRLYFDAWMPSGSEDIKLSDTIIADAVYKAVNETYEGTYKMEHTEYMVSVSSFANPNIKKGSFFLIRTPFGEIYHYSVTFKAGEDTGDEILYEDFSWIECPLVLFIVVAVFGYFTVTMPGRFRRYDVMKNVKLHTFAKVLLIVLLLLYFFAGFGSFFVSGIYIWIIGVVFLFVSLVVSKSVYENAARIAVMPEKPDTTKEEAKEEEPKEEEAEEVGREVQCATCGEIFTMDDRYTLASISCPACGNIGAVELGPIDEAPPPKEG